jgi:hypothetical protein
LKVNNQISEEKAMYRNALNRRIRRENLPTQVIEPDEPNTRPRRISRRPARNVAEKAAVYASWAGYDR